MLKPLNLATLLLLVTSGLSILPISLAEILQPVQAQTNETQQTEAERLLNLCREHLFSSTSSSDIFLSRSQSVKSSRFLASSSETLVIDFSFILGCQASFNGLSSYFQLILVHFLDNFSD
jgi:hypothetical protein